MPRSALVSLVSCLWLVAACHDNPHIDGALVPPIGTPGQPPACDAVCGRIVALCGTAFVGCPEACANEFDDVHRACVGQAASCRAALQECANEERDGGEDGGGDAGPGEDGGADAASSEEAGGDSGEDAPSD